VAVAEVAVAEVVAEEEVEAGAAAPVRRRII